MIFSRGRCLTAVAILAIVARTARAQQPLDEKCTVAVANRTAQVRSDGTWNLYNVPANLGPVRVRATCVRNGLTESGQSSFLSIVPSTSSGVPLFSIGVVDPVPKRIAVTAPVATLTSIGATTQLTATATLPDDSTRDVTPGPGTSFRTTNAAIATISASGLVTAVSSGTVFLSASYDGALGAISIRVVLGGDSDGDGIPDDVELANGMNPNEAVDALEDFDRDGLTNFQELVTYGTANRNADTDGDGIKDGEEVAAGADGFVTNPLLADTDGDGVRDGLEVATGTDPTNPGSFNLAAVLVSVDVTPADSVLTYNTIFGEAYRQLTVTGTMTDGFTLDLTAGKGTNYGSSDLAICNFGGIEGAVYAGADGVCTVTATNNGHADTARIRVRTFAPVRRGFVGIPGYANNVAVSGNYAYVAAGAAGLVIVDVSNKAQPTIVATFDTPGNANDVKVVGANAFVADGTSGLRIVNVSNPLAPTLRGNLTTAGTAFDLTVDGVYAYLAMGSNGLKIVDVSNPAAPVFVGVAGISASARAVGESNGLSVVVTNGSTVSVVNVTNPAAPVVVSELPIGGGLPRDVAVRGNIAYVADYSQSLVTVDLSNPASPVILAALPQLTGGALSDVALAGDLAFGADQVFTNVVPVYGIANPAAPIVRGGIDFSAFDDFNGLGIAADDRYVYLTASVEGVDALATGTSRFYVGQYRDIEDFGGIPPTVSVTAPASGAQVYEGSILPISITATDDVLVASVDFLVDGAIVRTTATAPYQYGYTLPMGAGPRTISGRAFDLASSVAVSAPVPITVIVDPPPVVALTNPAPGASLVEGSHVVLRATASDNFPLASVVFLVDGVVVGTDTVAPYETTYQVPLGITTRTFAARTTDSLGRTVTDSRSIPVIVDPLTTVTGVVKDADANPVVGATLTTVNGLSATSGAGGAFQIVSVPTAPGDIVVNATATILGLQYFGTSLATPPVLAGTTNVGTIVVRSFPRARRAFQVHYATSVAVADFNGDGVPDIAATSDGDNSDPGDVRMLIGQGAGNFSVQPPITVGRYPYHLVAGDVNGDGKKDLAVANWSADTISILRGVGNGTFQPKQDFATCDGPSGVALADFDGDLKLDAAVACFLSDDVRIYHGNGNGTFTAGAIYTTGPGGGGAPVAIVSVDLNGDGKADIATADLGWDTITVRLGNGNGTFGAGGYYDTIGWSPEGIAAADLDGDGDLDLGTGDTYHPGITIFKNHGDGTFDAGVGYTLPNQSDAYRIAFGDLDGDGRPEAVTANAGQDPQTVSVFHNNGNGTFGSPAFFSTGQFPQGLVVADVNADGHPDAITADYSSTVVSVLLGDGAGGFEVAGSQSIGYYPTSVAALDVNGDGLTDLAATNFYSATVTYRLGLGGGEFDELQTLSTAPFPRMVSAGFLNADAFPELVTANKPDSGSPSISKFINDGDGTFQPEQRFNLNFCGASGRYLWVNDLNADGKSDLIQEGVCTALGRGDGTFDPGDFSGLSTDGPLARGDFDGDGLLDLVSLGGNGVRFSHGNGDGSFTPGGVFPITAYLVRSLDSADFNGDGHLDVVTVNQLPTWADRTVAILLGDGAGGFAPAVYMPTLSFSMRVFAGDVSGDGHPDVAVMGEFGNEVALHFGAGDGTFPTERIFGVGERSVWLTMADVNGDGLMDLVVANQDTGDATILYGRGGGNF